MTKETLDKARIIVLTEEVSYMDGLNRQFKIEQRQGSDGAFTTLGRILAERDRTTQLGYDEEEVILYKLSKKDERKKGTHH